MRVRVRVRGSGVGGGGRSVDEVCAGRIGVHYRGHPVSGPYIFAVQGAGKFGPGVDPELSIHVT
jgi:hypothetical protein